jgi:cell division septation protein DedD
MMPFPRLFRSSVATAILLPALLAGCAQHSEPTQFAPLRYDYLGQMNLNVSSLSIVDRTATHPVDGDIGPESPTPPLQAVRQMAQDRLAARGTVDSANTARFVIDRASILHLPGGTLKGNVGVHLDILAPNGRRVASASAQASQSLHPDPSGEVASPANLYAVTRDMMQTLNVEFEYQVHHSLSKWLVDAGGTPVGSAIQSQSLNAQDGTAAPLPAPGATKTDAQALPAAPAQSNAVAADAQPQPAPAATSAQDAEPNPIFPSGDEATPAAKTEKPRTLSPKAGFLTLPGKSATGDQ